MKKKVQRAQGILACITLKASADWFERSFNVQGEDREGKTFVMASKLVHVS